MCETEEENQQQAGGKTMRFLRYSLVSLITILAFSATSASAAEPWWHINAGSAPANLQPEENGEIIVTAANLGDADANGEAGAGGVPINITDTLPAGLEAVAIKAAAGGEHGAPNELGPLVCAKTPQLGCTFTGVLPPYEQIRVFIKVKVREGASSGEVNHAGVAGGGALGASLARPLTISEAPTPFGLESYEQLLEEEGGAPATQAGSHPFQFTTTLQLNQSSEPGKPPALAKDLNFRLPPGLIGNPTVFPQCPDTVFRHESNNINACPADTALGVVAVRIVADTAYSPGDELPEVLYVPLFNLTPEVGEPARFGFLVERSPVYLDTSVRTGGDYGVTVSVDNTTQAITFISSQVTVWGVPGDPRHNNARGWSCLEDGRIYRENPTFLPPCAPASEQHPPPFLALPTSCTGPLPDSVEVDSWKEPSHVLSYPSGFQLPPLDGCNELPFKPEVKVTPDVQEASKPSGLNVDVHVPQSVDVDAEGLSASDVKNLVVTLPEGLILNPSAADGLAACPLLTGKEAAQEAREGKGEVAGINLETPQPANCPNASKIANVTIHTPLLPNPLTGFVYLASPQNFAGLPQNPFSKHVVQYLVAHDPVSGVLVKLAGSVELGGEPGVSGLQPGQIRSTFADQPQLPFEDAELEFFGGERAPLATPEHCGTYTTDATYTPWSGNEPTGATGQFDINTGPNDTSCPGASLPFGPSLASGSTNNNAGSFSELTTTLSRPSGNQNIQSVTLHYPPGLTGLLSGVELCAEAQANAGTCGPNSQIGETIVSVGVGGEPFTVTGGKAYITGPYNGAGSCTPTLPGGTPSSPGCAPFGLSIVNPAKAGPFDLQEGRPVVVRAKVEVNPTTAALTVTTNGGGQYSIPNIIEGFPLQIQHVNVLVNRPGFTINPTSCAPTKLTGEIKSAEAASVPVEDAFQVTNCAALKFTPKFTVSTSGKTSKANGAELISKVTEPSEPQGSQADITKVKVELPLQLPSRLTTLQKACTNAQFELNPANCPSASFIGHAVVHTPLVPVPLEGPAIFVSHGGEAFPSLEIVLQGYGVKIVLVGATFISKSGITSTTFKTVPDQPFSSFELVLPEGPYSALAANGNLCAPTTTKTVSKKVTVKVKGKKKTETRKVKQAVATTLQMPNEFVGQNGAVMKETTDISVSGCAKTKPAKKAKKKKKQGKKKK